MPPTSLNSTNAYMNPSNGYQWKLLLLAALLLLDLVILATGDYDFQPAASRLVLSLFALTFLAQFGVMCVIYLLMASTVPFQYGLVGLLRMNTLFVVIVVYLLFSCFSGGMRVVLVRTEGMGPTDLLTSPFYATISSIQKLIAPVYYAMNLKSAFELGHPAYYQEDAWGKAAASLMEGRARLAERREHYGRAGRV